MSSAQIAAKTIKDLEIEDWQVLEITEKSIPRFESVPLEHIVEMSKLHPDQIRFRIDRLNSFGFLMHSPRGYILNTAGLDVLALNAFVKKNLISGMGRSIGMGKESDVFETINEAGVRSVIKFFRIGRISFRATRKTRAYTSPESQHQWLTINIHAAMRESIGMSKAHEAGVNTPELIDRNRHAVLMSQVDGIMLYRCKPEEIPEPGTLLKQILEQTRIAYTKARTINGDLSEYNVLFDGERPWIIDWPQFVELDHPNADELLQRDVQNVISFFKRKYGEDMNEQKAISYVKGMTTRI